jgi:HlyD family secretion protein
MKIIAAILKDIAYYFNPKTKSGAIKLLVVLILVIVAYNMTQNDAVILESSKVQLKTVRTASVASLSDSTTFKLIGSVKSVAQADIQTETSGRITTVNVKLGQTIVAGTIIATLENASQYATLLQAEGAYDAAIATAAQSDISTTEAQTALKAARNSAQTVYQNAFATFRSILHSDIDQLFSDPQASTPGVRIHSGSDSSYLNAERVAFETLIAQWGNSANLVNNESDFQALLAEVQTNLTRLNKMLNVFIVRLQDTGNNSRFSSTEIAGFARTFELDREKIISLNGTINTTVTSLTTARETLSRTELGGTASEISTANAQVKQALGSLRAAQATYSKTILRTPIAGVVNALDVQVGDFATSFTTLATIANNNALEITTFVGDDDRTRIAVGDSVSIENDIDGTITAIAPAVNAQTRKVEVKISTESQALTNGDSVSITISPTKIANTTDTTAVSVPLTSVKLTSDKAFVFTVEEGVLVQHEVILGKPNGSTVKILEGINSAWEIVVDARGLIDGRKVTVDSN